MTNKVQNIRAPLSFEEAMKELDLLPGEFIDIVRWADLAILTRVPTGTNVSLLYQYQPLSFVATAYPSIEFTGQVDYLHVDHSVLSNIAWGGRERVTRFELITFSSGQTYTADELHQKVYLQSMERAEIRPLTKWESIAFSIKQKNVIASLNCHPWFSISKSMMTNSSVQSNDEASWSPKLDYEGRESNQIECIDMSRSEVLFFSETIHELKVAFQPTTIAWAAQNPKTKIQILNDAATLYKDEISIIKDFREYWNNNKDKSRLINHLSKALDRKKDRTLEDCIRVLINDDNLYSAELATVNPRKDKYPHHYSDALMRLNEAGNSGVIISVDRDLKPSILEQRLLKLGFKTGATTHLKVIINGR
jgi:hypothetical protein